jgi:LCP family protein required for cell wall assembly
MQQLRSVPPKSSSNSILLWGALLIFIVAVALTGLSVFTGVHNVIASGSFLQSNPSFSNKPTPTSALPASLAITPTLVPESSVLATPWDGASRVTLLFFGLDYRDWEAQDGPPRTDTMILFSIDPLTKSAGMLNIPRDLWVNIPGSGYGKINTAYPIGEGIKYPGGGAGLAVKTVESFIGIPINYYAQLDFSAFEDIIDDIGGIDINIPEKIEIAAIGGHMKTFKPGIQHFDGRWALAYARARYTEGGDFDRAERQQQVILAVRDKVLNLNMLPTLVSKAPTMFNELSSGVHTNLTIDQIISLAWLAQSISTDNIKRGVIAPPDMVTLAKSPDGSQDILKPISSKIRALRDEIFANTDTAMPTTGGDIAQLMKEEAPRIEITNASGESGLAGKTADYLKSLGVENIITGDAGETSTVTKVTYYTGKPYTLKYLVDLMKIDANQIHYKSDAASQVDIAITLGSDWAKNNPIK